MSIYYNFDWKSYNIYIKETLLSVYYTEFCCWWNFRNTLPIFLGFWLTVSNLVDLSVWCLSPLGPTIAFFDGLVVGLSSWLRNQDKLYCPKFSLSCLRTCTWSYHPLVRPKELAIFSTWRKMLSTSNFILPMTSMSSAYSNFCLARFILVDYVGYNLKIIFFQITNDKFV